MAGAQALAGLAGHLGHRRDKIAGCWYEALLSVGVASLQTHDGRTIVAGWVDQLIELVLVDSPDRTLAGGVGATLADFAQGRPEVLGVTQEVLAGELVAGLPPQEMIVVHPRVISLMAALAVGFMRRTKMRVDARYRQAEAMIEARMSKVELLRRETHHRVRNNLAILVSLFQLQSERSDDPVVQEALRQAITRIRTMAYVHEQLYRADRAEQVHMHSYIYDLLDQLVRTYGYGHEGVRIQVQADEIVLDADLAISLGLIINELASNALKYAFEWRDAASNEISVSLHQEETTLVLQVRDNGKGLPESLDVDQAGSFGLTLIRLLVRQMGGTLQIIERKHGAAFEVIVPGIRVQERF